MTKSFLLEIGIEEMPAHVVTPSIQQLQKRVIEFLKDNHLTYQAIKPFSTPRRLALLIEGLADKQTDIHEESKGPAKKIALDENGNWTKAAQGFARGQGLSVDDLTFKTIKDVDYIYVEKTIPGQPVQAVLPELKTVIMAMTFPTRMHWADYDFEYIRPIHWIVALLDNEVIDFDVLNIQTGQETLGHRFLGQKTTITHADEYEAKLNAVYVIADAQKRKSRIEQQINNMAQENQWQVDLDSDLLEEVTNLVEWPTAFFGEFDKRYLTVPKEVLITSMKDNQRYFYATDTNNQLLPVFIGVRNGNEKHLDNVIAGNQKVLAARLEDASFFYQEDQKQSIDDYVEKLKTVSFHDKIGSLYEKMQRVGLIANFLGHQFGLTSEELADLKRASEIYKFDLVTGMVGEFPELQGVMGEKYAQLAGEKPEVALAIKEHYWPISADGKLPSSQVGAVLAIADKFDSIADFFTVGMIPSGSNDPYALRRQAYGIIRILAARNWHFPLKEFFEAMSQEVKNQAHFKLDWLASKEAVVQFLADRVRQRFTQKHHQYRHDIVESVLNSNADDPVHIFQAAKVLRTHQDDPDFKSNIEALNRVIRLSQKSTVTDNDLTIRPELFENQAEQDLYQATSNLQSDEQTTDLESKYQIVAKLRPLIDNYFEETMVMVEDQAVQQNRLNQLMLIAKIALELGDLTVINTKE